MRNLVIGGDSGIGSAIMSITPGCVGTSRRSDSAMVHLDVSAPVYPKFDCKFDMVYFCIAVDGSGTSPEDTVNINATQSCQYLQDVVQYVEDGGTVRVLTSIMGSLVKGSMMPAGQANIYYRMSKAALNMGVMELSKQFPSINWQLIHPGFVNTKLTRNLSYIDQAADPLDVARKIVALPVIGGMSYIELDSSGTRMVI